MTLNQAIKTLNIEGRRLTVPSVRKLTGIKSDAVIRAALDKFKADLRRKEKEAEEKSQMDVKYAEIVVRWRKNRTWGSTCTAEAKVETKNGEWHYFTSPVVSGCGYDKHSQALSYVFNAFFKGMIWRLTPAKVRRRAEKSGRYYMSHGNNKWAGIPFAFCINDYGRYWQGAIGTGPYMEAVEFLGGKMRHTYFSDDLDIWTIKF